MSSVALHRDKKHKYKNGFWTWKPYEEVNVKLKFYSHAGGGGKKEEGNGAVTDKKSSSPHNAVGLSFTDYIDEAEEKIFREIFQRRRPVSDSFNDSGVITIQDVKNLVLFTIKSTTATINRVLIEFLHTSEFDEFLHATIFYIDHFLLILEYLLIRRDESAIGGKVRDMLSMRVERFLSKQLSDRRLLMAREYSKILVQSADENKKNKKKKKKARLTAEKDLIFFESMIDFTIQCTFIAMHRRAFNAISCELNRLFRTEFFNIAQSAERCHCRYQFNFREQQILYGQNWHLNSLKNYRQQNSPLMFELLNVSPENEEILKIGCEKYLGSNRYLFHLELQFVKPECHLHLIEERRGILGHPKDLYDTMLNLNENALLKTNFSDDYDPHGLIRRVFIEIHTSDEFVERRKNLPTRLIIHREPYGGVKNRLKLWKQKDLIMTRNQSKSIVE